MLLRAGRAMLSVALLEACGGQTALDLETARPAADDAAAGTAGTGTVGVGGRAGSVGAGGRLGAGGSLGDAASDAHADRTADVVTRDAPIDRACTPLDPNAPCGCPAGDWFVELRISGASTRLTAPHVLKLHCTEDAPVVANNGCNDVLRLGACAGSGNTPPCFYLAASPTLGFLVGFLKMDASTSHALTGGSIELTRDEPPVREGVLKASTQIGSATVPIEGSFLACAAPFGR